VAEEMPIVDEAKVKRLAAFLKYAMEHWGMSVTGSMNVVGQTSMEELNSTEIDGINIGEVYRELKADAVKRMKTKPIEDVPSDEEFAELMGDVMKDDKEP
jgi:hypothetical protein